MPPLDVSSPATLSRLINGFISILGEDLVAEVVKEWRESASFFSRYTPEEQSILGGLAKYLDDPAIINGHEQSLLALGLVAYVILEAIAMPGGEHLGKKLRDLTRAHKFNGFFETFFEAEAAIYWRDQMQAEDIEFPAEAHPDFWFSLRGAQKGIRLPNECKRISSTDIDESARDELAIQIDKKVRILCEAGGGVKVIVWLHAPVKNLDVTCILSLIEQTLKLGVDSSDSTNWVTACHPEGFFQVSIAGLGDAGEMLERPIHIVDVPVKGAIRIGYETKFLGKSQDPGRMKYIISVRSDVLPKRVGGLEQRLKKAIKQVAEKTADTGGIIHVRLRPPRGLGDLYEADLIVRRILRDERCSHVCLVVLYWNEGGRGDGGRYTYTLTAHFIANTTGTPDFAPIDSGKRWEIPEGTVLARNPNDGGLVPWSGEFLRLDNSNSTLTVDVESQFAVFVRMHIGASFQDEKRENVFVPLQVGQKNFLVTVDREQNTCFIEFKDGKPIAVATLDLRAWNGAPEAVFALVLDDLGWKVFGLLPTTKEGIIVRAVKIRKGV